MPDVDLRTALAANTLRGYAGVVRLANALGAVLDLVDEWDGKASWIESNFLPGPNSTSAAGELQDCARQLREALTEAFE